MPAVVMISSGYLRQNMGRPLVIVALLSLSACASAPPYARCGGDTSCAMGACTQISFTRSDGTSASGQFCTNDCHADADCPDNGICIALSHDPSRTFFCARRCATSNDCAAGLACTALVADDGSTPQACLP